jgi:hypothetical protein
MPVRYFMLGSILFASLYVLNSCASECNGKLINVALIFGNANDTVKIFLNGKFRAKKIISTDLSADFHSPTDRLFRFCTSDDSVQLRIQINSRDTSFSIETKDVNEVYIGSTMLNTTFVLLNTETKGLGNYSPVR